MERRRFPFNRVAERKQFNCLYEHRCMMAKYFPNSDLLRVFPFVTALEVTHPRQSGPCCGASGWDRSCSPLVLGCSLGGLPLARSLSIKCALLQAAPGLCMLHSPFHCSLKSPATTAKLKCVTAPILQTGKLRHWWVMPPAQSYAEDNEK